MDSQTGINNRSTPGGARFTPESNFVLTVMGKIAILSGHLVFRYNGITNSQRIPLEFGAPVEVVVDRIVNQ